MQITIDTSNLTDIDRAVLAVLLGDAPVAAAPKPAPAAKAAAPKPAPAKKAEPEPEPEAEDEGEAVEPEADDEPEVTMEDATKAATKLVSSGDAAKVKAALTKVGAKRVSEIDEANLAKFVALLQG